MPQFTLPHQKQEALEFIDNNEEKLTMTTRKPNRSLDQNDLWHATLDEMAKSSGYTPDEMKAIIKQSITNAGILNMIETKETATGMPYTLPRSSAKLKTNEMTLLIDYTLRMQEAQQEKLKEYATDLFS